MGGIPTMLNLGYSLIVLPITEWLLSENDLKNDHHAEAILPKLILILLSSLHLLVTVTLIYGIVHKNLHGIYIIFAAISSGINAGTNGIVVAHELIHKKEKYLRNIGIFNLVQVNYGHFYIEHIKGHHKYVGTQADPATAKYGENLYAFIIRTIRGQFLSAFFIESKRLYDRNKSQLLNFVLIITIIELIISLFLFLYFGSKVLLAYVIYSIVSVFLLEYVNYIEHYGLKRDDQKKFEAHHAWQSNKITSRLGLIELSRHADHHMQASKPFHALNSHPGYYLPSGYFGMFYIAIIPTLWFKMINPIIDAGKHKFN
jgi:alkane 1-monooxygenase